MQVTREQEEVEEEGWKGEEVVGAEIGTKGSRKGKRRGDK